MNRILFTNPNSWAALVARLALGIAIFPHGAQKALGWFGGGGISNTMNYLTEMEGLPIIIAVLVILIEFLGSLFLIFGFLIRLSAFSFICHFLGVVIISNFQHQFFMNWGGTQSGEGLEYFILLFGLAIALLITGGGKASIDALLVKNTQLKNTQ